MRVNWAKNHPDYMRILNNKAREELQYRSLFEIYYGRKSNKLVMAGIDVPPNVETQVKSIEVSICRWITAYQDFSFSTIAHY